MITLERCPFCNGKASVYFEEKVGWGGWHVGCYTFHCPCHIDYSDYETQEQALLAWNERYNNTNAT